MIVTDPFFHDWTTRIDCGGDAVDDDDGDPSYVNHRSSPLEEEEDEDEGGTRHKTPIIVNQISEQIVFGHK
ncbi:hypothetical protein BLOT_002613 [Blomia tropicalis]|nr:hypothetical protein BLOT_002613 [Blomia tropicalis]